MVLICGGKTTTFRYDGDGKLTLMAEATIVTARTCAGGKKLLP